MLASRWCGDCRLISPPGAGIQGSWGFCCEIIVFVCFCPHVASARSRPHSPFAELGRDMAPLITALSRLLSLVMLIN